MTQIIITDEVGVERLAGDATFPDGLSATQLTDPAGDVLIDGSVVPGTNLVINTPSPVAGGSDGIEIRTGDALGAGATAATIVIEAGDADPGAGFGGNVEIQPGSGDTPGTLTLFNAAGDPGVRVGTDTGVVGLAFFAGDPHAQQTVTGALSAVVDPAAAAVLASIIAALAGTVGCNLVVDGTT